MISATVLDIAPTPRLGDQVDSLGGTADENDLLGR